MVQDRVLNVKVNSAEAIDAIIKTRDAIDKLKKSEKELKDQIKKSGSATEEQRRELEQNKEAQKAHARQIQVLSKEVQNNIKLGQKYEDSLRGLRSQLSAVTAQYDALSRAEREGAEGKKLKKQINDITTELKGAEEATQRYYRNVGNYANSIGKAFEAQIPQITAIRSAWDGVRAMWDMSVKSAENVLTKLKATIDASKEAGAVAKTAKTLTAGVVATVGLLTVAIVGLVGLGIAPLIAYFKRTQEGTELFRKGVAGLTATIDVLLDRAAKFGEAIVKLFTGDFVGAANTAKAAFQGIGAEIREETNMAIQLSEALQNIEKRELALSAQVAASKVQLAQLKRIADDTTRSYEEREDAARRALGIEINLAAKAKEIGEDRIANMTALAKGSKELNDVLSKLAQGVGFDEIIAKLGLSESTKEDYEQLVDAFNQYQQQVLEFTEKQVEGNNKLNSIRKARTDSEKAAMEEMLAMEKELDDEIARLGDAYNKAVEREWQLRLETLTKGSAEEYNLRAEQLRRERDMQLAEENTTNEMRKLIWEKYNQDMRALAEEQDAQELEQMRLAWSNKIAEAELQGQSTLQLELDRRKAELDALHQMEGETNAEFYARQLEAQQAYADAQKNISDYEVSVQQAKMDAIAKIMGGLSDALGAFGEDSKALAIASKVLALGEIAINTGKAISAGVAAASGVPFPGNLAAIATTVATVLSNVATATQTIKSAKFATGGYVSGAGSGTSDSIPSMLSNGESVNNALSTAMFSPIYSALNQMGGGIPIIPRSASEVGSIAEGEEMLARAVARGVAELHPVVSVEEINRVSDRGAFVNTLGDV